MNKTAFYLNLACNRLALKWPFAVVKTQEKVNSGDVIYVCLRKAGEHEVGIWEHD